MGRSTVEPVALTTVVIVATDIYELVITECPHVMAISYLDDLALCSNAKIDSYFSK